MRILFVCTGNQCRSPVAERLTRARARTGLAERSSDVDVVIHSAGIEAPAGRAIDRRSARALHRLGGDATGFASRVLTADMVEQADLVLVMTRDQRRTVVSGDPRSLRKTFTLLEAADLLRSADLDDLPSAPDSARAAELARRLDAARAHRPAADSDDVLDPIGRRSSVHARVASQIATALRPLVDVLFPSDQKGHAQPRAG